MSNDNTPTSETSTCCGKRDDASGGRDGGCCQSLLNCCRGNLAMIYGAWLLRAWLGVRALQTGVEKWAGIKGDEQPPFPRPPVRPNGCFRGLPQKAKSLQ